MIETNLQQEYARAYDKLFQAAQVGPGIITYCGMSESGSRLWQVRQENPSTGGFRMLSLQGTRQQVRRSLLDLQEHASQGAIPRPDNDLLLIRWEDKWENPNEEGG